MTPCQRPPLPRVAWQVLGDFAGIVLLAMAGAFVLIGGLMVAGREASEPWVEVAFSASLAAALLQWERKRPLPPPVVPVRARWPARKAMLLGVLAGCGLLLLDRGVMWLLVQIGLEDLQAANDQPIRQALQQAPLLTTLSVGLVAPWLEERFIRGRLLGRFRDAGWPWAGLLLTSLLFAWLHEFAPDADQPLGEWLALMGLYAWSGLAFGLLYLCSGRLRMPIAAHATNNLVLCLLFWLEAAG